MAERSGEFVGSAHIDEGHGFAPVESPAPFTLTMLAVLILVTLFPQIALVLVR